MNEIGSCFAAILYLIVFEAAGGLNSNLSTVRPLVMWVTKAAQNFDLVISSRYGGLLSGFQSFLVRSTSTSEFNRAISDVANL